MQNHFDAKLETMVLDPSIALQEVILSMKLRTMDGYIYTYLYTVTPAVQPDKFVRNRSEVLKDCGESAQAMWETFNQTLEDQQFIALYTEKMFINKNNIKEAWIEIKTEYLCSNDHPGANTYPRG